MIRGMYTAAAAMLAQMVRQQVLAHNLANVNTPGFRHDRVAMRQFPLQPFAPGEVDPGRPIAVSLTGRNLGDVPTGVLADLPGMSLQQGALRETLEPLDFAVVGPAYFGVQRPDGVFYTRDGRFFRNSEGALSSTGGGLVLGADMQPIVLPQGQLDFAGDGTIRANGQVVGQIGMFSFPPDTNVEKFGVNLLRIAGAPQPAEPGLTSLHQGFIEQSNVDVTQSTTEVVAALRSYEASQRLLQMQDQLLERVVTEVGRVG